MAEHKEEQSCCSKQKEEKVKECCCHESEHKHEDECCCQEKNIEEKEASCCCNHEERTHDECCCHHDEEKKEKSCCEVEHSEESCTSCHHEEKQEKEECCCHHDEKKEQETCCCNHEEIKVEKEHCCCGGHEEKRVEEEHCCCSSHTKEAECHCHDKEEEEDTCSCCGVAKKKTTSSCSCCGSAKSSSTRKEWIFIAVSAVFTVLSYLNLWGNTTGLLRLLDPAIVAIVLCGAPIYKGAVINLVKKKKITSALLISVALTASVIMGILYGLGVLMPSGGHHENYFFVAAEISVLMAIGETIEDMTTKKSRSAIEALIAIAPKTALALRSGEYVEVRVEDLVIGDTVMIKPNSDISVDGEVISGVSSVNQANLTGESLPVEVREGSTVRAGTVNLDGAIYVKVTALAKDSLVSKLAEYVKNAEKNKSPTVQMANRWAGYIVPAAIICSILVFIFCCTVLQLQPLVSLERAITILVVFCPCALGLSVPTAVAAAIGCGSRKGVLIKSGRAMEELADIGLVAFDKTGTLTEGRVRVNGVKAIDSNEEEIIRLAASAEASSEHVLALAVYDYAKEKGIKYAVADSVKSLVGLGVSASIEGKTVEIANARYAEENYGFKLGEYKSEKETLSCVIIDGKVSGIIYFGDTLRGESKEAIEELRSLSVKTCMLTGDSDSVANAVAKETGVDIVFSGLLPEDKAVKVEQEQAKGIKVAMIGDGVNDAMALSAADCSVAMGVMGNDVAIRSADVALMKDDMRKIPFLVRLARRMKFKMKFNIILSMTINVLAVVLSTLGLLDAVLGAVVHNCSSVIVCTNSALLIRFKGRKE